MSFQTPSNIGNLKTKTLEVSGLEGWYKKMRDIDANIEAEVKAELKDVTTETAYLMAEMASKHIRTGVMQRSIKASEIKQSGYVLEVEVGIDTTSDYEAWHAVFIEYGGHHNAADPFIRPAIDTMRPAFKQGMIQRAKKLLKG
jgi:HK97 gp10 family phage protein